MKNKHITKKTHFFYFCMMLFANLIGAISMLLLVSFLGKTGARDFFVRNYKVFAVVYALVGIAISNFIMFLYFKRKAIPNMLSNNECKPNTKEIKKIFCLLVLPSEIIRFILTSLPTRPGGLCGYRFFDGFFAMPANLLYDQFYLMPNNRLEIIRETGYTFVDNALFILVCLLYFALNTTILYFAFLFIWKKYEKQSNTLYL